MHRNTAIHTYGMDIYIYIRRSITSAYSFESVCVDEIRKRKQIDYIENYIVYVMGLL